MVAARQWYRYAVKKAMLSPIRTCLPFVINSIPPPSAKHILGLIFISVLYSILGQDRNRTSYPLHHVRFSYLANHNTGTTSLASVWATAHSIAKTTEKEAQNPVGLLLKSVTKKVQLPLTYLQRAKRGQQFLRRTLRRNVSSLRWYIIQTESCVDSIATIL